MDRKDLLKAIKAHLRLTRESRYAWGTRVMKDKAFIWKVEHYKRQPRPKAVRRIMAAIKRAETKQRQRNPGSSEYFTKLERRIRGK